MPSALRSRPVAAPPSAARVALVVAMAHGLNDAYAAFVPPLLPRIMDRMGLELARFGDADERLAGF